MNSSVRQQLISGDLNAIYGRAFAAYKDALKADVLMSDAEQATGLSDWGGKRWAEDNFRARLDALCTSLQTEVLSCTEN